MLDEGIKKLEKGWEAPILWKPGQPNLPDNRVAAEHRIRSLVSHFKRDSVYESQYRAAMQSNLD